MPASIPIKQGGTFASRATILLRATFSRKAGLLAGLGILLGVLTWASATALGLGTVLANYPLIYSAIRHFGAIYLARLSHDQRWHR